MLRTKRTDLIGKIFNLFFTKIVEKCRILGYNKTNDLGCAIIPVILNLQNFKRDSYISVICQASDLRRGRQKSGCGHPPSHG